MKKLLASMAVVLMAAGMVMEIGCFLRGDEPVWTKLLLALCAGIGLLLIFLLNSDKSWLERWKLHIAYGLIGVGVTTAVVGGIDSGLAHQAALRKAKQQCQ